MGHATGEGPICLPGPLLLTRDAGTPDLFFVGGDAENHARAFPQLDGEIARKLRGALNCLLLRFTTARRRMARKYGRPWSSEKLDKWSWDAHPPEGYSA
jgi:hypothetical protein